MSTHDIIRAWRDEDFRIGIGAEQNSRLPESPIGYIELSDEELGAAVGADSYYYTCPCSIYICTIAYCYTPVRLCQWP